MRKVLTAAEMREVDRLTTEKYGIPSIILMENAAHAAVRVIAEKLGGSVNGRSFLVICGHGNNGGDGAVVARILWTLGADVTVAVIGSLDTASGDARTNFEILTSFNYRESLSGDEEDFEFLESGDLYAVECPDLESWNTFLNQPVSQEDPDVLVDALFGTGLSRPLEGLYAEVATFIRGFNAGIPDLRTMVVSLDIPSGMNTDVPDWIGVNAKAHLTVTFTAPKPANVVAPTAGANGELVVASIGSPSELVNSQPSQLFLTERGDAFRWLRRTKFANSSYKSKRGHALIVAGSENYSGAAVLCGNAAIRSGVGLVTIGTPRSSKESIAGRVVPEVMVRSLAETETGSVAEEAFEQIREFSNNVDAIAIGSGISANNESTARLVRLLVKERWMPTILDADALTLLSPFKAEEIKDESKPPLILTPHQGEFLKMLGTDDPDEIKDRVAAVRQFAQKHHVILILKGERTLIAEPGGKVVVNPTGNSGLGKAGNGDTLTGIVAGFAAQAAVMNVDMFKTVVAAVYIAGLAGDIAEERFGKRIMTASDVRDCLGEAFDAVSLNGDSAS